MNPSSRSAVPLRRLAAAAAIALVPAIAGCEAGANAPTLHWHQPTPGKSAVIDNSIHVADMFVLGPAPGFTFARGASAPLYFVLTNTGSPDRLIAITAPHSARSVQIPAGGIRLGRNQQVLLTGSAAAAVLRGLLEPVTGGGRVDVVLHFLHAGSSGILPVPVLPRSGAYATFSPAPRSPSPRPTPTHVRHHGAATSTPSPATTP